MHRIVKVLACMGIAVFLLAGCGADRSVSVLPGRCAVYGFEDLDEDDERCGKFAVPRQNEGPAIRREIMYGYTVDYHLRDEMADTTRMPTGDWEPRIQEYPYIRVTVDRLRGADIIGIEVSQSCQIDAMWSADVPDLNCEERPLAYYDKISSTEAAVIIGAERVEYLSEVAQRSQRQAIFGLSCVMPEGSHSDLSVPAAMPGCPKG